MDPLGVVSDVVRRNADRVFLVDTALGRELTFREFDAGVGRLARLLRSPGLDLARGDRLVVLLPNSVEFAALYFAALQGGVTLVPLNGALHPRDLAFAVERAGAKALVHAGDFPALPASVSPRWRLPLWPFPDRQAGTAEPARADDLLTIVFTSGTTARPKAVAHKVGSLFGNALAFNEAVGLGPEHRFLHLLPMSYSGGFFNQLISPFLAGASVVMTPGWGPRTPLDFWRLPREHGVNALWLTPTMAAALLRVDRDEEGRAWCREQVRLCNVGMAPLPARLKRDFEATYGVPLYESYGLSETLLVSANRPAEGAAPGSVGRPLAGVEVRIQDGEVMIRTPHLMAGTLDLETGGLEASDSSAWFASGDLGELDRDGRLRITGRKKDVIIRAGLSVSPRAIEEELLTHEAVDEAAVVG
ncbi:MAG: acyl--CoA ligase, partial [Elusimicrobia bacterium]|nr:acyl--CoA ligase [Elusimicrobiota bacterium]